MSAKEMFKELTYEYSKDESWIHYKNKYTNMSIDFHLNTRTFIKLYAGDMPRMIFIKELQAINKQCQELGW